jgi:hypothetical protein
MDGKYFLRVLSGLVLVAAVAGIAYFAFNAGVIQGAATKLPAMTGQPGNALSQNYGWPFFWHPGPFFGFGCLGPLLALFLLIVAARSLSFLLWGSRWSRWGHRHHGWGHRWDAESGVPPMFRTWHDNLHGSSESEKKD